VATSAGALPRAHEIAPDWRVAIFTLVVSLVTGASFALLASLAASRADVSGRLRASGRGTATGGMRGALVVSQISLSVVLLVGSLLLVESLRALARVDVGFDAEGLIVADMTFSSSRFPERTDYLPRFDETLEELAAIPGVGSVSTIRRFPFRGAGEGVRWTLPGAAADDEGVPVNLVQVSPGLFETMGVAVLEGTDFGPGGDEDRPLIIGRSVARAAFGVGSAVGRTLLVAGYELEIAGVVEDIRQSDLRGEPRGILYLSNRFNPRRAAAFVVRPRPGVTVPLAAVRAAVRAADPEQPITELALASDIVAEQLMQPRFYTLLLAALAGLALTLCSVGVYGVVAFGVSRRTREVGIRIALGAEPARVRSLVVRQGMRPVVVGIAVGLGVTLVASRALDTLLFAVPRFEPAVYLASAVALGLIGLAACWLPARRAAAGRAAEALAGD
jgi:predicted permease